MSMWPFVIACYLVAGVFALGMLGQLVASRRRWRMRRRLGAGHRLLWAALLGLCAALAALVGSAVLGYQRLTAEAAVAVIEAHALAPQRWAVSVTTPAGARHEVELGGDQWQLDARVIKWKPGAILAGAPALYQLDRIGGRYADIAREREAPRSVFALSTPHALDLWQLTRRFPRWLAWVDADYGSSAYLPLVDAGRYEVSLAAAGGLIARPADPATAQALRLRGWHRP